MIRFLHTADWQIGKPFGSFGATAALLREARLASIPAIGEAAMRLGVRHVLVAGDVYDAEQLSPVTRRQPVERMRRFDQLTWWLLPGNHDPHRPGGLWEQVMADGLPDCVRPVLTAQPVEIEPGAFVLPAPLRTRNEARDLTAWMDTAATPDGAMRIGLAHGSTRSFSQRQEAPNPVEPGRRVSAGLDYLALGDWHRTHEVAPGVWYAGTPEPDRFDSQETGQVLLVEAHPGGAPKVEPVVVGRHGWKSVAHLFRADADVEGKLAEWTRQASPTDLWQLELTGALGLAATGVLDTGLERLEAGLAHLVVARAGLMVAPGAEELASLELGGILGEVAARLRGVADGSEALPDGQLGEGAGDPQRLAGLALQRLWRLAGTGALREGGR